MILKKPIITVLYLGVTFIGLSCSSPPLRPNYSGQTIGAGKVSTEIGSLGSEFSLSGQYGLGQNLDISYITEFGNTFAGALFLKYSLFNNSKALSLAFEVFYGLGDNYQYYGSGLILSRPLTQSFELLLNQRAYSMTGDAKSDDDFQANLEGLNFIDNSAVFFSTALGCNLWFSQTIGLSFYNLYLYGEKQDFKTTALFGGTFIVKI